MSSEETVIIPKKIVEFTDDGVPYIPPYGDNRKFWGVFRENEDIPFRVDECFLPREEDDGCGYDWILPNIKGQCDIERIEVYADKGRAEQRCEKLNKSIK